MHIEPGTIIDDKFEVEGFIGQGGMGAVYKAQQTKLERTVALKMLNRILADKSGEARFEREAMAISSLKHRNIVKFYGYGSWQSHPYMVMEYVDGTNLENVLEKNPLPVAETLRVLIDVSEALAHAHAHGVIHRDLKPSNIMLVKSKDAAHPPVKLIDFGLAKTTEQFGRTMQALTDPGYIVGSLLYLSPEQCVGDNPSPRSDIYSLGCILHHCLTGLPPFYDEDSSIVIRSHIQKKPPSLPQTESNSWPEGMQDVLLLAMAKNPAERYQNMGDLLHDLRALKTGTTGSLIASQAIRKRQSSVYKRLFFGNSIAVKVIIPAIIAIIPVAYLVYNSAVLHKAPAAANSAEIFRSANDHFEERITDRLQRQELISALELALQRDQEDKLLTAGKRLSAYEMLANLYQGETNYGMVLESAMNGLRTVSNNHLPYDANVCRLVASLAQAADEGWQRKKHSEFVESFLTNHKTLGDDPLCAEIYWALKGKLAGMQLNMGQPSRAMQTALTLKTFPRRPLYEIGRNIVVAECFMYNGDFKNAVERLGTARKLLMATAGMSSDQHQSFENNIEASLIRCYARLAEWDKAENTYKSYIERHKHSHQAPGLACTMFAHRHDWPMANLWYHNIAKIAEFSHNATMSRADFDMATYEQILRDAGKTKVADEVKQERENIIQKGTQLQ